MRYLAATTLSLPVILPVTVAVPPTVVLPVIAAAPVTVKLPLISTSLSSILVGCSAIIRAAAAKPIATSSPTHITHLESRTFTLVATGAAVGGVVGEFIMVDSFSFTLSQKNQYHAKKRNVRM